MQDNLIDRDGLQTAVENITWYSLGKDGNMHPGASDEGEAYYRAADIMDAIRTAPASGDGRVLVMPCELAGRMYAVIMKREREGFTVFTRKVRLREANLYKACTKYGTVIFTDREEAEAEERRIRRLSREAQERIYREILTGGNLMIQNGIPITPPNARELHCIEFLEGLYAQMKLNEQHMEARLKSVPDCWRQWRMARSALSKTIAGAYKTVPDKTIRHMQNICQYGEIIIRQKGPVKTDDVQIVPSPELKMLINIAIANECAMCLKDSRGQHKCKLRKAMMLMAPPVEIVEGECPYLKVATQCKLGEYI